MTPKEKYQDIKTKITAIITEYDGDTDINFNSIKNVLNMGSRVCDIQVTVIERREAREGGN